MNKKGLWMAQGVQKASLTKDRTWDTAFKVLGDNHFTIRERTLVGKIQFINVKIPKTPIPLFLCDHCTLCDIMICTLLMHEHPLIIDDK